MTEIQFTKKRITNYLIILVIYAFVLQLIRIIQQLNVPNIGMLDMFVFNPSEGLYIIQIICWSFPLFIGVIGKYHFGYYSNIKDKLLIRVNKSKFIINRAIKGMILSVCLTIFFYFACFIFLFIIVKIAAPDIYLGTSLYSGRVLNDYLYFFHPLIYLGFYIILSILFNLVFSLVGFIISLYTDNRALITVGPFIFVIISTFLAESLPYGLLFSYNNIIILTPSTYRMISKDLTIICFFITPILLIITLLYFIFKKSKRDI